MRIAVVGAGVSGVTSAYELAAAGHGVTVFERSGSVATGASFAATGLLLPSWSWHWSSSMPPGPASAWAARLRLRSGASSARTEQGRQQAQALLDASLSRLDQITQQLRLDAEHAPGSMVLLRTHKALERARAGLVRLADAGLRFRLLNAEQAREVEPGLNPQAPLRAAIHFAAGGVLNCRQFVHGLRAAAQAAGVAFRFNTEVRALRPGPTPELELGSAAQADACERFDAVVVCAGTAALTLLAAHGFKPRWRVAHGLSVTAPVHLPDGSPDPGPRGAVLDPASGLAISRLGSRVRVAGGYRRGRAPAEGPRAEAYAPLYQALEAWFPGAATTPRATHWHANVVETADDLPRVGPTGLTGVWLNLAPGRQGWSIAVGLAHCLAQAIEHPQRLPAAFMPDR